jgi:Ni/Co efflux regulator RcnB
MAASALLGPDCALWPVFSTTTREEGMTMKQLFAVLVAAMFAATSFAALAQDKKDKGMDKKAAAKSGSMDKKSGGMDKKAAAKSSSTDKKSGSTDKKAAKKSAKKSETK